MSQIRAAPAAAAPAHGGARPIGVYLMVLAFVALVPGFIFSAVLLQRNNEAQQAVVHALTQTTTQAIASGVDRHVQGMITTLRVLATAQALPEGDLAAFHERATTALAGTGAYLLALDGAFNQVINTRVPFGTPLTPTSDPESAARAIESGRVTVSDLFYGRTAETFVYNVLLPLDPPVGRISVLVLTQNAGMLAQVLSSRELPDGWNVALIDGDGTVMAATSSAQSFAVGEPSPLRFNDGDDAPGRWRTASLEGTRMVAVSWAVPQTGWRVVAFAPRDLVERPFADAVWALVVGGALLAVLVAAVVWWITNRIARSVGGLAAEARQLGQGARVEAQDYPISEIADVSAVIAEASRARIASETEVRFLMREVAHRSKNQMSVIVAMAKQSARSAESVPGFVADLERRIFGLARSTDLLLAHGASGVDLRDLVLGQIDPFLDADDPRVTITGPPVRLNNPAAQILGMAIHELSTNAVKYGAFAQDAGSLAIVWELSEERLVITWREHASVVAPDPPRRGFGTVVLETMVGASLGARVERTFHRDGFACRIDIPRTAIDPAASADGGAPASGDGPPVAGTTA